MQGLSRRDLLEFWGVGGLVAFAAGAHFAHATPVLTFVVAAVSIAGLAHLVGGATEQLGSNVGASAAGAVQSALGNLPELFIALFALHKGLVGVVQAALVGSVLANSLLVLGIALTVGGLALTPAIHTLHLSEDFAGLVIVAIAGNAVENVVGVQLAARNKPDFAISVIVNSSLQIALVLTPVLVFVSLFFATPLTLVFPTLLAISLLMAAAIGALVVYDGESTWAEGVILIGLYVVIAASFWWGA